MVFELGGGFGQISWGVGYENPPTDSGSGDPVSHPGDSALKVNLTGVESPYGSGYTDLTFTTVNPRDTSTVLQVTGLAW